ncbi:MAG: ABC transporter ATP-binding protein [Verrucomicrobia bacterium]|nr:ABC transporter ATP-binding protein [Verrucomicrobiota bacterium]
MDTILELRDVQKHFRRPDGVVQAMDGVSLRIGAGEFVAVQGPSGSGKTTLLMAAGVLMQPDSGVVVIAGEEPYKLSAEQRAGFRAAHIGFVFQQFHLVHYLNVLDNVLTAALALPADDAEERARGLIERFGLASRAGHVPSELSIGERQRAALARALLNRPKLLLADEPTGNLDEENGRLVLDCLAGFAKDGGAVLLVTHDPKAAGFSHRALRMENGKLAAG